jgi:membrane glycosyltransferase
MLSVDVFLADGAQWVDAVRILLLVVSTAWLAWGAAIALNGLVPPMRRRTTAALQADIPDSVKVAVLIPVYNEDPVKTCSHIAAMAQSVVEQEAAETFHFALLSDTNNEEIAQREEYWFGRLRAEVTRRIRIFYRRRSLNTGRKAGNIADFIQRSGGFYDYLIILDADSLLEGATMVEMVRRMEADPKLGLLQSLPKIVHARSLFGRTMQFAASLYSPIHARGLAALQGCEGTFWGHNAIVRTRAFAQCCGLPVLPGKPPFGGHVLSHDFVEAALLARSGWKVCLAEDLEGSYEEGPENLIDHAKRDRRWCQGNLQHVRVMTASGLLPWSRFIFVQGIMSYLASPIWALFLAAAIVAPAVAGPPVYFAGGLPVFPPIESVRALALLTGVFGLLLGPKLLIVLHGALTGANRAFGGTMRVLVGVVFEIVMSTLLAPLMLLYQCRSVGQVVLGLDSGWPAANRHANAVSAAEAWAASWWIGVVGCATLAAAYKLAPELVYWVLLPTGPAILAPLLIQSTSMSLGNIFAGRFALLGTPTEARRTPVMRRQQAVQAYWCEDGVPADKGSVPLGATASHVPDVP